MLPIKSENIVLGKVQARPDHKHGHIRRQQHLSYFSHTFGHLEHHSHRPNALDHAGRTPTPNCFTRPWRHGRPERLCRLKPVSVFCLLPNKQYKYHIVVF